MANASKSRPPRKVRRSTTEGFVGRPAHHRNLGAKDPGGKDKDKDKDNDKGEEEPTIYFSQWSPDLPPEQQGMVRKLGKKYRQHKENLKIMQTWIVPPSSPGPTCDLPVSGSTVGPLPVEATPYPPGAVWRPNARTGVRDDRGSVGGGGRGNARWSGSYRRWAEVGEWRRKSGRESDGQRIVGENKNGEAARDGSEISQRRPTSSPWFQVSPPVSAPRNRDRFLALDHRHHRECTNAHLTLAGRIGSRPVRVLDVGCGTGKTAAHIFALSHPGSRVVGIDTEAESSYASARRSVEARGEGGIDDSGELRFISFEECGGLPRPSDRRPDSRTACHNYEIEKSDAVSVIPWPATNASGERVRESHEREGTAVERGNRTSPVEEEEEEEVLLAEEVPGPDPALAAKEGESHIGAATSGLGERKEGGGRRCDTSKASSAGRGDKNDGDGDGWDVITAYDFLDRVDVSRRAEALRDIRNALRAGGVAVVRCSAQGCHRPYRTAAAHLSYSKRWREFFSQDRGGRPRSVDQTTSDMRRCAIEAGFEDSGIEIFHTSEVVEFAKRSHLAGYLRQRLPELACIRPDRGDVGSGLGKWGAEGQAREDGSGGDDGSYAVSVATWEELGRGRGVRPKGREDLVAHGSEQAKGVSEEDVVHRLRCRFAQAVVDKMCSRQGYGIASIPFATRNAVMVLTK